MSEPTTTELIYNQLQSMDQRLSAGLDDLNDKVDNLSNRVAGLHLSLNGRVSRLETSSKWLSRIVWTSVSGAIGGCIGFLLFGV